MQVLDCFYGSLYCLSEVDVLPGGVLDELSDFGEVGRLIALTTKLAPVATVNINGKLAAMM